MSQIFPTNKEKRSRTSSNETNTSFVKNMTSRVSGLLPLTITKWFSSPSNANGSAQTADASDSSTEDEASETPVITQPPAKRMRYNNHSPYNLYGSAEASCSTNDVEVIEMPYSPFSGSQYAQPSRSNYTTPLRPPNEDQDITEREEKHKFKLPHTVSSIGQSISNKRKSIFDTNNKEESIKAAAKSSSNTMADPKQPSFKPSLLGSPFYPGRTMYGGASSSYINQPNIKQQTVAVVNESKSNDDTAISSSARRVMDLLESYSSPLMEARRIPLYTKPKNEGFNTSTDRSPYNSKRFSYKTQELYVPSIASILQLKKKSRLMDTTNAARQIIASHSSASHYPAYPTPPKGNEPEKEQANKMTTKVKSRLTRTNRGKQDELDMAIPVELPTAVLQIDQNKLPKFSFDTPMASKPFSATSTPITIFSTADKKIVNEAASKPETVTSSIFKFSNPVTVSSDYPQMASKKFTFGSPAMDMKIENKSDDCSVVVGIVKEPEMAQKAQSLHKTSTKSKEWQCSECWVKNKPEENKCVCCGAKQPSQKPKCSVCKLADCQSQKDKCAYCEKAVLTVASPLKATSTVVSQSTKWKCEDCWVSNDGSAVKCACCGGSRPGKASEKKITPITATITSNKTTMTQSGTTSKTSGDTLKEEANWKCDDCWISNKSSVDKCAACGGARSGPKQSASADVPANTTSFFGSNDNTFKNIIKTQKSDKWECSSCLVQNESCKAKCACCGAEQEGKKKNNDLKFNFGKTVNNSFKFGIDPKVQEVLIAKPQVISTIEPNKPIAQSETNNNILSETPTFTFTLPTKKVENKSDETKGSSEQVPKMNFTFGITKQTPALNTNKVLESNKKIEEERPQEVPSVNFNSPIQEKPKLLEKVSTFPSSQAKNETTAIGSGNVFNTLTADAKKDTPSNPIILLSGAKTETPATTFSFGVNTNSKVFDTTPKTSTTVNMFTQPIQTPTLPTTSAPLSLPVATSTSTLFQQPDLTTKPASLFQNSETNTNATPGPIFGFGNNGISNATPAPALTTLPAPEKPKFQFTFGSTIPKTESQNMFKSTFGSTESNTSSFSLPAGTTLGSVNTLPTNTLGGSNGLSTTNGVTGNLLPGNTLGALSGNSLTGNTLGIGNPTSMTTTLGGSNGLAPNSLSSRNSLQTGNLLTGSATGLFNNTVPKDNVWSANNTVTTPNLFVPNTTTSSLQKPPTFTFGSTTAFNQPANPPTFGNNTAPPQNIFGLGSQSSNTQPSMFSSPAQNQPTGNLFGSTQPAGNSATQMSMFGAPSIGATPTFGSQNPSIPTFETPSLTPAPAPTFNFGATQSTGIFGFGQQQQQQLQSPAQPGVYSFGGAPAVAPQVQFTMGSNPAGRRVRKAVRRNPPR